MIRAILKPKEDRRLLRGHLWAYRDEFKELPELNDGELVDVYSERGRFVGRGFYQTKGGIAVRILSSRSDDINEAFFNKRIATALALRRQLYPQESVYRWIFGESDGLPGLIADRYGATISVRGASTFYAQHAQALSQAFMSVEGIEGVHMKLSDDILSFGSIPDEVICSINGVQFNVNIRYGQKTGLFLDQRDNWRLIKPFVEGARVFDGHCYAGAWALYAATQGAAEVYGTDSSKPAIESATANAALNNVQGKCRFEPGDVQEALLSADPYDIVMLDPPALAKSRTSQKRALGAYQALNRDAMKALKPGGILVTSSCSQPIDSSAFREIVKRAANSAQRRALLLHDRGAAADHPVLLSMPETAYLNCLILRIL